MPRAIISLREIGTAFRRWRSTSPARGIIKSGRRIESGKGGGQSAATAEAATEAPADGSDAGGADGNNGSQGEIFQALRVQFTLPSSSYATMFLRELCKQDSSTKHAKSLNHK